MKTSGNHAALNGTISTTNTAIESVTTGKGDNLELHHILAEARDCPDGIDQEKRTVYAGVYTPHGGKPVEVVVKAKQQMAREQYQDSIATKLELDALTKTKEYQMTSSPHLVTFIDQRLPKIDLDAVGRSTYLVMTKMPGRNLLDSKYWSLGVQERLEIQEHFLMALNKLKVAKIMSTDRALRNIMWEPTTKTLSIIDFELWEEPPAFAIDEEKELQLWGLKQRPPPPTWHEEWWLHH